MTWIADWKCEKFNAEIDADLEEFGTLDFIPVCEERKNQFRLYDNPMLSELRWGDLIQGERNGNTIFLKKSSNAPNTLFMTISYFHLSKIRILF